MLAVFSGPFSWRRTDVYNIIEDCNGVMVCFISMNENMDKTARQIVEILNKHISNAANPAADKR